MQPSSDRPKQGFNRQLRRYGPLAAIVVAVAVVGAVVAVGGGDDDEEEGRGTTEVTVQEGELPEGVIDFETAQAEGSVDDYDFGEHCDEETGVVALPYRFSPPCFASTGEATQSEDVLGVTDDTIKVVAYLGLEDDPVLELFAGAVGVEDTQAETRATYEGYAALFDEYYQSYGRTVELQFVEGTGTALDASAARADAARVAEMEPFAVWGGPVLTQAWADELANRGIFCVGCLGGGDSEWYEERAPFVVGVAKTPDQTQVLLMEYLDKKLAGRPAVHAGDPELQDQDRRFAYVWIEVPGSEESAVLAESFEERAEEAGIDLALSVPYQFDIGRLQEQADTIIARLKDEGVTTVVFYGDPVAPANFTQAATGQEFFPEWVVTGSNLTDTTVFARTYDQRQWAHAFGISAVPARADFDLVSANRLYTWFTGEEPPAEDTNQLIFLQPALFMAGVHFAGPNLTPETFSNGLFARPPAESAILAPAVSYGDHDIWPYTDYTAIDDVTEVWWDADERGPSEIDRVDEGMYQFVDGGRRYLPGEWTEDETRAFDPEGAVTVYSEPPPGDEVPDYPSPAGP